MIFEWKRPELATIIRWTLRVVLVVFLAWLVKRKPEEEEEEEADSADAYRRNSAVKSRTANARSVARLQPRPARDPLPSSMRQRRYPNSGESFDFDSVIDKVSKPKDMWEVRRGGDGTPKIVSRTNSYTEESSSVTPKAPSSVTAGFFPPAPSQRKPLQLEARKQKEELSELPKSTLHGHERPVTHIGWNKENNLLFTCSKDKIVSVWTFPDGECLGQYKGHNGAVWAAAVTSDSKWLVTSGADRLVIVWEARTSRELARVELPGVVRYVEWANGSGRGSSAAEAVTCERFVTCHNRFGAQPPALTIWDYDGNAIEQRLAIPLPQPATQVRWGRQDYLLASAHETGELVFWRADTGAEVKRLQAHDVAITKFDFSSDRELVATASLDKRLRVWDLGKGSEWKLLYEVETDRPLNAVAFGPLTRAAAVAAPDQRPDRVTVIAAGGQDVRDVAKSGGDSEQFGTLLFKLGDGETFPDTLKADGVTKGHFGPVHTLAFTRDGAAIASGSEDGCVRLHVVDASALAAQRAAAEKAMAQEAGKAADPDSSPTSGT